MSDWDEDITFSQLIHTINNKRMKIYQKPTTDIDVAPQWEGNFMYASLDPLGDRPNVHDGLPIFGGTLRDPSFSNTSTFSRYSVWMEDEEIESSMLFDTRK
jgi:hypothetical protein